MSMGMLFEDESARKSFRSECLLIRLWMLRLASKGLDEFEKFLLSVESGYFWDWNYMLIIYVRGREKRVELFAI